MIEANTDAGYGAQLVMLQCRDLGSVTVLADVSLSRIVVASTVSIRKDNLLPVFRWGRHQDCQCECELPRSGRTMDFAVHGHDA